MAVTQAQAKQAHDAALELMAAAQALLLYTNGVNNLFDSGFIVSVGGEAVVLPTDVHDRIIDVAKYQLLKSNVATPYNKLP